MFASPGLRISWPARRRARRGNPAAALLLSAAATAVVLASGCGGNASPAPSATPVPTPTPTPNPHLQAPASVDAVFRYLTGIGGLRIVANTASVGVDGVPSKVIDATYAGWPLTLSQFASRAQLVAVTKFSPKDKNRVGDPPFTLVGLNILVEYGPRSGRDGVTPPDPAFLRSAQALVAVLDPLLSPLAQRSVQPLALPTPIPSAGASPVPSQPSKSAPAPTASPRRASPSP